MTLRERLKDPAGFIDADFEHRDGLWSVDLVEDPDHGWYLVGKTGRACRSTLAFPVGCSITFLADSPALDMQIEDSGMNLDGRPVLVLRFPETSGLGLRECDMAYFCDDVDGTIVKSSP